ncbi:hypothetical protein CALVIDRAFT_525774 [Calocera viscosa TUFC12733]|uniref:C2H2-type domain-containing protein n=1 Tax=Calocera viscosa (strain TUFC12733) TaxID=1330018 RepID=A0A167PGV3_CALVF|nr:hypothetical protein CALVIDRAFT_525774 [Calocera viscosa TUFC12733]
MATPLSFQRNGQRISILNPPDEPPPASTPPALAPSDDGRSPTDTTARETLSPGPGAKEHTRKLHQCAVCFKSFTTSGHHTRHARIHTGVKPHVCPYPGCEKDCSRLDNLIQHYRVHLPKEDRGRGNPYIRACMLDLPVPIASPGQQIKSSPSRSPTPIASPTPPASGRPPISPLSDSGGTTLALTPPESEEDPLAGLWPQRSYAHKESFVRGM